MTWSKTAGLDVQRCPRRLYLEARTRLTGAPGADSVLARQWTEMALFEPIIEALNASGARYVVVGGVAVVLHGHPRLTADLDIAVDLATEPARAAIGALTSIGLQPRSPVDVADFANPDARAEWIEERGMVVFSMADPSDPLRAVDLFVADPIDFESLWTNSEQVELEGTSTRIASIPDLIQLKRISGRPVDLEDIEALEALLAERGA